MPDDNDLDDFLADDQDPKRKNMVSFEIDVNGDIVNEHNEDNSDDFFASQGDGTLEIDIEGEDDEDVEVVVGNDPAPEPEPTPQSEPEDVKQKSRSNERIRTLAKEKNDAKEQARLAQQERDEYKLTLENVSALYLESEKTRLQSEFEQVKKDISYAASNQDTEAYAEALVKLNDVTNKLALLNDATPVTKTQPQPQATTYSTAAEDWMSGKEFIINNDEYAKLPPSIRKKLYPVRQDLANMARELIAEGWNNTTPEFYEELDMRMSLKHDFYEALALEGVDVLQSEGKEVVQTTPPSSGETSKPTTRTVEDKKKQVPVSGPTSSGSSTSQRKNSQKIKLSKEDMNWYENHVRYSLGPDNEITLAEYAKMVMDERKKTNNG